MLYLISLILQTRQSAPPGKNFPYIHMLDALRDGEPFFDIGEDYPYINEVKTLKQLGIVKGNGKGYLKPHEYITREEAMLMVYRLIKALRKFEIT